MTSPIVNNAVTVLAHRRLTWLRDALLRRNAIAEIRDDFDETLLNAAGTAYGSWFRRVRTVPVVHGDVESQILWLTQRAIALLEGGPPVRPGGGSIGKYAVLGGAGYDWFGYSALFSANSSWLGNVVRRGSPDANMSHVVAPALKLALRAVELGLNQAPTPDESAQIRAFGMGMVCSVAANVLVNPVLRGATAGRPTDTGEYVDATVARLLGDACGRNVLELANPADYSAWWPTSAEIPDKLLIGMIQALDELAGVGGPHRPAGFPDFDRAFAVQIPPVPAPAVVRNALPAVRAQDRWGYGWWLLYLLPFGLTTAATLPLALTWPKARSLFLKETPDAGSGKAATEVLIWSQSIAMLGPLCTTIYLRTKNEGNLPLTLGFLTSALDLLALIFGFVTLGEDPDEGWRWLVWALPLAVHVAWMCVGIFHPDRPLKKYAWTQAFPGLATAFFGIMTLIINAVTQDADSEGSAKDFTAVTLVMLGVVALALMFILPAALSGPSLLARIGALEAAPILPPAPLPPADPPRLPGFDTIRNLAALGAITSTPVAPARVFDESTLWVADPPANAGDPVGLAALRYPAGNRPMLTVWWTGAGALEINPQGDRLRHRVDGAAPVLTVLPPAALTPDQLAAFLESKIAGLRAAPVLADAVPAATHPLPYPAIVEDTGDAFAAVGTTQDHGFALRHATRAQLTAAIGRDGPAVTAAEGWPLGPSAGRIGDEGTAVGLAADLAALLCLAATSRLHDGPLVVPRPIGAPLNVAVVSQVFRQWNLDERRLNEWQMLVAGNAFREKPAPTAVPASAPPDETVAAAGDDAMLANAAASPPIRAGTSALADTIGWLPAFRAWARVAGDIEQDPTADTAAPYSPHVQLAPGNPTQPTNRNLTEIMRYLLDLPR